MLTAPGVPADSLERFDIPQITVSASIKQLSPYAGEPAAVSSFLLTGADGGRIAEPKSLSLTVPNFLHADYGSKMTGSIYIRGIGSRMDQPAMGLYVDNVPVMNKNNFDFDYFDVRSIDVLRGPQGTLYGRNTIGGVIDVHTLSPMDYQGTRLHAGFGSGNTWDLSASTYHRPTERLGLSLAVSHRFTDGFFKNDFDDSHADRTMSDGVRAKVQYAISPRWRVENTFYANYVEQSGFAYSLYDEATGKAGSVDHNDPCSYERTGITDGLLVSYRGDRIVVHSSTSYQYTDDRMTLDQDFTPRSMFTIVQAQKEHTVTQEFVARSAGCCRWDWISGLFGFYRGLRMDAPVMLKRDGIDELILANANRGLQMMMPGSVLEIEEDQIPIESRFRLPGYGFSAYHQSSLRLGRWTITGGIRADYEHVGIRFDNDAVLNYRITPQMPQYKELATRLDGERNKSFFEWMPRLSVTFDTGAGVVYASASRGYKAGGFNTQMFSDIMQSRLMSDMMADLGFGSAGQEGYDPSSVIYYKPEYSWNYELGAHLELLQNALTLDAALFYVDARDQQLTVFPPGKTTGRMMSNAGRTESYGIEFSAAYRHRGLSLTASYGHTNATFRTYVSGKDDFAGKHVPYAPLNTVSAGCAYTFRIASRVVDALVASAQWQGAGRIYWNEQNTLSQPFYGLLDASLALKRDNFTLGVWAKNLTGNDYNTFYFKSVDNPFVQRGKPFRWGVTLSLEL